MKNHIYFLVLGVLALAMVSCSWETDDIFSESSAVRIDKAQKEVRETLISAENGWVMDYFATQESEGYTFIMKFLESSEVKMVSKNKHNGNVYRRDSCAFQLISDTGPVLTFNTGTERGDFHVFSDPSNDGRGLEGDYEFIVIECSENQIKLKGKKNGTYIYMNKLANDVTWENYFASLDAFQDRILLRSPTYIKLISNNTLTFAANGASHIFSFVEEGKDPIFNTEYIPFIIYPDGIRFQHPFTVDGKEIQSFKLSDDWNRLICTDEGSTDIYFEGRNAPEFFFQDNSTINRWGINRNLPIGSKINSLYQKLVDNCKAPPLNETLTNIYFTYEGGNARSYALGFTTVDAKGDAYQGRVYFNKEMIGDDRIKLTYSGNYNTNARYLVQNIDGFTEMIQLMNRTFIISTNPYSSLNLRNIKMVAEDDDDISFIVSL